MRLLPSLAFASAIAPAFAATSINARADNNSAITSSATFRAPDLVDREGNFTFTISTSDDGDIWFRMSCWDRFAWCAVGLGPRMKDTLMFVAYRDGSRNGVTLSGRIGLDHVEPEYDKHIDLEVVDAPSADHHKNGCADDEDQVYISGHCKNCTHIAKNAINLKSDSQPFIWAVGPIEHWPWTSDKDGPLRRHSYYGGFKLDLTVAKSNNVPIIGTGMQNTLAPGRAHQDRDYSDGTHAFAMVLAFLIIFPAGIFSLRIMNNTKLHMIFQTFGLLLGIIGMCLGLYLGQFYNRSKHFHSLHQILGLIVCLLLIGQWVVGFLHHRAFTRTHLPWLNGKPIQAHRILGSVILAAGLTNAALGFKLAVATYLNAIYVPVVIIMLLFLTGASFVKLFLAKRRAKRAQPGAFAMGPTTGGAPPPPPAAGGGGGWGGPAPPPTYGASSAGASFGGASQYEVGPYRNGVGSYETRSDIALGGAGEPPAYSLPPVVPKHMI